MHCSCSQIVVSSKKKSCQPDADLFAVTNFLAILSREVSKLIPMLLILSPKCSCTVSSWSMISWGMRLRAKPPFPVAQNVHLIGHPT